MRLLSVLPFLLPSLVLAGAMQRPWRDPNLSWHFAIGAGLLALVAVGVLIGSVQWRQPFSPAVVMLNLTGLGWLIFGTRDILDWYVALSQAILLIFPLSILAYQTLRGSGVIELRRAQMLAEMIERRPDLPMNAAQCRELPEVKAFREAIQNDPTPGIALLSRGSAAVQVAALCALECHKRLPNAYAQIVVRLAQHSDQPAVRAAAALALGNVEPREVVELLAVFLRDKSHEVRQAAAQALLPNLERRWQWLRPHVQQALADSALVQDGPLWAAGRQLPDELVADLHGWAAAGGPLGVRAAATLAAHYRRALAENSGRTLIAELLRLVMNGQIPTGLRHELAQLLLQQGELTPAHLQTLMHSGESAPLRLFAADSLLSLGEHPEAVRTLRELAHVPNRELAVATAAIVQRRLGIDLGLNLCAALPALHTRQAAEITRRVMRWAAERDALEQVPERVGDAASLR